MNVDLHVHSNASDGTFPPSEIVKLARDASLAAVALTDHDTISGIPEFLRTAAELPGVKAVPGVEISVEFQDFSIHIIGLFLCRHSEKLDNLLCEIRRERAIRNELIAEKLVKNGYKITMREVAESAGSEVVGRPHFAKVLVGKGYFSKTQEVFDRCLKKGRPCYCSRKLPLPSKAIGAIHSAGGTAFWAHPFDRSGTAGRASVIKILKSLLKHGLDGIEAYYSTFTREQQETLLKIADEYKISVSGGSDFHGTNMDGISLGSGRGNLSIPASVYENLAKKIRADSII